MQSNAPLADIPDEHRAHIVAYLLAHAQYEDATGCVNWTGNKTPKGYGRFRISNGANYRAHRVAWILAQGRISDAALVVDHLCRNRGCINPAHLELVTNEENLRRGDGRTGRPLRRRAAKVRPEDQDACTRGHAWPEFLRIAPSGKAWCTECKRLAARRRAEARRDPNVEANPQRDDPRYIEARMKSPLERTQCVHGHPWPEYLGNRQSGYYCRRCASLSGIEYQRKKRAAARAMGA
jgi:hypothetical protein